MPAALSARIIGALILLVRAMPLAAELLIDVTFDAQRGYIAQHPQLAAPVVALSLSVLRARIGAQRGLAAGSVRLKLDRVARAQRDQRLRGRAARLSNTRPV